ncbi:VOC family protein [Xanthobacter dioxanivorans]|uniref:VOC family protein n=1 Tax=Xanthobacter dioxanivorans TaxID=2528964 RepID=A0A974PSA4_9HYPH|nr:VOC family protein [Xanthobacter dioxanivorans]QRG08837.1 VOC family protein [Xanthobacter dioxanivorans]
MTDSSRARSPIFPALRYADGHAAIAWLERAFGFAPQAVHDGPDGALAHAELTSGDGLVMLGSGSADPANPWSTTPMGLYVRVDDIDAHYARAQAAGAEIVRPLAQTSYGAREYSARDPGGHLWSFGTYDPWAGK